VRLATLQSVICARAVGSLVHHDRCSHAVSDVRLRSFPRAVHRHFRNGFILSWASLRSRVLPCRACPCLATKAPSLGLRFLFATSTSGNHRRVSSPSPSVLGVSRALDGLLAVGLVGLFRPTAAYRIRPPGVFPPAQWNRLVDDSCPRDVDGRSLSPVARRRHSRPPHPQGFDPCGNP